jgi:prepilin-type N-terminal cleavage/methylation domain-containing protein
MLRLRVSSVHAPRPIARLRLQRGFTLVEMVISAGLIGFLAITATWFWVDGLTLAKNVNTDSAVIAEGRAALERLSREIREIKYNSTTGSYCISTMSATQLVFNKHHSSGAEVNNACGGGGTPTSAANDIAVSVQLPPGSTALTLGYAGALATSAPATPKPLTTSAGSLSIVYRDAAFSDAGVTAATVRMVDISLTVQASGTPATPLKTVVALRNF